MPFQSNIIVGYGKSHSSFGEIVQGRLSSGEDFLITLPIDMWSICNLTCIKREGPLVINCDLYKSKQVSEKLLEKLGVTKGFELTISFSRNIPIGKGLSSSTADMLSTVRALQEVFGFLLRNNTISNIFIDIEPHDGLMHKSCVIYNHRKGKLLKDLMYIPKYWVVALDLGGQVDTVNFNHNLDFTASSLAQYDLLYQDTLKSFEAHDDVAIAECATRSTEIHLSRCPSETRKNILSNFKKEFGALGIQNTHSGTCIGLLFKREMSIVEITEIANKLKSKYQVPTFVTNTLRLLN